MKNQLTLVQYLHNSQTIVEVRNLAYYIKRKISDLL